MKIALACDHAGFVLKDEVIGVIKEAGFDVVDFGTDSSAPVDYPDFAVLSARAVAQRKADRAVIICGSGVGACVTANKIKGVRAAICHDTYSAAQGVWHDDMNVLCLGARIIGAELAKAVVKAFLTAKYTNEQRHNRRLAKVLKIENDGK